MAIGSVSVSDTRKTSSNPRIVSGAFGAGVGAALQGLGSSLEQAGTTLIDIKLAHEKRQNKKEDFDAERDYIRWQGEETRRQETRISNAERDGAGLTNQTYDEIVASENAWLETIPERLRPEYQTRMEQYRQNNTTSAFRLEYEMGNNAMREDISTLTNTYQSEIYAGRLTYEDAYEELSGLIEKSALPEVEKVTALEDTRAFLRFSEYKQEVKFALEDRQYTANLTPGQQRLLGIIGTSEAAGQFNIRYNGHGKAPATFDSFADHPRIYAQRPDGRWSSAAGIAQFTAQTWDEVQKELNLPDFSPESQIKAMFYLAEKRYNEIKPIGLSYDEVLESDDPAVLLSIKQALSPTWEAFEVMDDQKFLQMWGGEGIVELEGMQPNLWNDPRFKDLSFEDKLKLSKEVDSAVAGQQSAEATQLRNEMAALREQAYLGARFGTLNASDLPGLMERGIITKASEVESFEQQVEVFRTETQARGEVVSALSTGDGTLTKPRHEKALNEVFGESARQALANGDQDYINGSLMPMIEQAGFIPSSVANSLLSMAQGSDQNLRASAYDLLTQLNSMNPYTLRNSDGFNDDMLRNVEFMGSASRYYGSSQEALQQLDMYNSPEFAPTIKARREEAQRLLTNTSRQQSSYNIDDIPNLVFDTYLSQEPELSANPTQKIYLGSEYRNAFIKGFELHGTEAAAADYAKTQLLKDWGVTKLGGTTRIIKNGPEKFYPEEAHIDLQVRREITAQGLPYDTPYEIIPLPQTAAQGMAWAKDPTKAGHNAAYEIMLFDTTGAPIRMLSEDGRPWTFDGGVEKLPDGTFTVKQLPDDIQELFDTEVGRRNAESLGGSLRIQIMEVQNQLSQLEIDPDSSAAEQDLLRAQLADLKMRRDGADAEAEALKANESMLQEPTTQDTTPVAELSLEDAEAEVLRMFDQHGKLPTIRNPRYRELIRHIGELKLQEVRNK